MSDTSAISSAATPSTAAPPPDPQSQVDTSKLTLGKDLNSFLTLLTSQLKNQDPLSPMDSTQFTNQLTSFAQVEQQIDINQNLTNLISLSQQSIASSAVNYIGKTIEGPSDTAPLTDGQLKASYNLSAAAQSVNIAVKNSNGDIVFSQQGATDAGVHEFDWDGKDANGLQQPDGNYTLQITALASDNTPVNSSTTIFGKVTGVTTVNNAQTLLIGTIGIPVNQVLGITDGT